MINVIINNLVEDAQNTLSKFTDNSNLGDTTDVTASVEQELRNIKG